MKIIPLTLISSFAISPLFAGTSSSLKLSNSFTTSSDASFDTGLSSSEYNFVQASAYSGADSEQNYLILEGFEERNLGDSSYLQSDISAVDEGGNSIEIGSMQIDIDIPDAPENVAYSPIVGIIPRVGSFDQYLPVYNASEIDDECKGSIRFWDDGAAEFRFISSGQLFIGSTTWELSEAGELIIATFSATDGVDTYTFSESSLIYLNGSYSGALNRTDDAATFESMTLSLSVNAYDTDGDGVVDISDTDTEYWYGPNFYPYSKGNSENDVLNANLIWSGWFGNFAILEDGVKWIYHYGHGYFYPSVTLDDGNEYNVWLYDLVLGWVYADSGSTGYIFDYGNNRWLYFYGPVGDERSFYDTVAKQNIMISKSL